MAKIDFKILYAHDFGTYLYHELDGGFFQNARTSVLRVTIQLSFRNTFITDAAINARRNQIILTDQE